MREFSFNAERRCYGLHPETSAADRLPVLAAAEQQLLVAAEQSPVLAAAEQSPVLLPLNSRQCCCR